MLEKEIKLNSDTLKYKEYNGGNSGIILILHGWGGSSDSWIEVAELLKEQGYRILIPELPGSSNVKLERVYTLVDMATLMEELAKKLGLNDITLLGHSNGGALAIKIASRMNLGIKKLILNNSAGIRKDLKRMIKRNVLNTASKILKPLKNFKFYSNVRKTFYKGIGSLDYINSEKNNFLKETYLNMIASDLQEEMKIINNETILIWGEKDTYTPFSDGKKMNLLIKDSKMVVMENERHGIHLHNPSKLVEVILKNI